MMSYLLSNGLYGTSEILRIMITKDEELYIASETSPEPAKDVLI